MFQCLETFGIKYDSGEVFPFVRGTCYLVDVFKPVKEGNLGIVEVGDTNTLQIPINVLKIHFRRV